MAESLRSQLFINPSVVEKLRTHVSSPFYKFPETLDLRDMSKPGATFHQEYISFVTASDSRSILRTFKFGSRASCERALSSCARTRVFTRVSKEAPRAHHKARTLTYGSSD